MVEERGRTTKKLRSREGDWAKGLGYSLPSWSTGGCTKQLVKEQRPVVTTFQLVQVALR